ncbi:MAG: iron ABC transporter permease [Akkermansiaceae bacterium]|nr:iron ABC transporter permease [Armatimonadota bacterium]
MTDLSAPRRLPLPPTLFALSLLLFISLLTAAAFGEIPLAPGAILHAIGHRFAPGFVTDSDAVTSGILFDLRLTRVLLAALVGAALAVAGVVLQGLTQNSLADPYTVGVSSGASVGAGIAVLLGVSGAGNGLGGSLLAFVAALLTMVLVFTLSRIGGRVHTAGFLLAGIVVGSFLWSVTTLLLTIAQNDQKEILSFLMGRFNEARWPYVALLFPLTFAGIALFTLAGRGLDAFAFGEETARSVGVDTERFKAGTLALSALLTAASVSVAGIIGFVGLIAPHVARALVGPPHRGLVPASALVGATLCVVSDLIARTVLPGSEIPVGVVTALLGAPFFALLLRRQIAA